MVIFVIVSQHKSLVENVLSRISLTVLDLKDGIQTISLSPFPSDEPISAAQNMA